jgi:hypothetical protein
VAKPAAARVHFVNRTPFQGRRLTKRTYTVRNVNTGAAIAEMSTKCTPAALPSAVLEP